MGFAQKTGPNRTDGFLLRVPTVEARMNSICFKLNLTIEGGRIVEGSLITCTWPTVKGFSTTAAAHDTLVNREFGS